MTFLTTSLAAMLALATGGMAIGLPDGSVRMANIKVPAIAGYEVFDSYGQRVGHLTGVKTDQQGRARWIDVALDGGGQARIASFRAFVDMRRKQIDVAMEQDLLLARAGHELPGLPGEPVVLPEMSS